ncbi:hypothetical protein H257_18465 [Aphanomyces astaci]|uniref:Uncharacterized protein n=1 Tax=Aphanomyces astaci TaxID=112090 RepID=W4FB48_APHAT|nr:hypothetical protein H257_18465 [Aphanomyces astaci]ETV64687.1 hypothetical protein H257_18465 [Aphanomyces astaci]|eukprot:XP_009845822.1 hypothetical protein H257_18465 [Aphanomyces astaci]
MSSESKTKPTQPNLRDLATPLQVTSATDLNADAMTELLARKQEINDLRTQPTEPAKLNGLRAVESRANDLLRKVKFNENDLSAFKVKIPNVRQLRPHL